LIQKNNSKKKEKRSKVSESEKANSSKKIKARRKARTKSINNKKEFYLANDINLPIEEDPEAFNKDIDNNNIAEILISVEMQITIRSARSARNRQLSIRYK
jgi:hypothetical protein